jgi:hypothetical protein
MSKRAQSMMSSFLLSRAIKAILFRVGSDEAGLIIERLLDESEQST